jgi:hypothetical protein
MFGRRGKSKHQPVAFAKYVKIHDSYMESYYKKAMVVSDTLNWDLSDQPMVTLKGKIFIGDQSGLCLYVSQLMRLSRDKRGRQLVRIDEYTYNLYYDGKKKSEIFRYDNFDIEPRRGHKSTHHCHRFMSGKEQRGSPYELLHEDVPTLGQAIEEAYEYYLETIKSGK